MIDTLIAKFPGKVSKLELEPPQDAVLVEADTIREFFRYLKDDTEFNLNYLSCLSGVDAGEHLEVVYHINSTTTGKKLTVKVKLGDIPGFTQAAGNLKCLLHGISISRRHQYHNFLWHRTG